MWRIPFSGLSDVWFLSCSAPDSIKHALQDPQALQVQLPGQQVPEAQATARDEDELVLELAHHLPHLVPGQSHDFAGDRQPEAAVKLESGWCSDRRI